MKLVPESCDPQHWVDLYLKTTASYTGDALFVSLGRPRKAIKADTTRWLHRHGIEDYTAHSTRGAAATTLLHHGSPSNWVQALGDWESTDSFNKFNNRLVAMGAFQQCLVDGSSSSSHALSRVPLGPDPIPQPEPEPDRAPGPHVKIEDDAQSCKSEDQAASSSGSSVVHLSIKSVRFHMGTMLWGLFCWSELPRNHKNEMIRDEGGAKHQHSKKQSMPIPQPIALFWGTRFMLTPFQFTFAKHDNLDSQSSTDSDTMRAELK